MNWDAVGAVAEILGALAVVLTLVYLSRQISHSNQFARRQDQTTTTDQASRYRMAFVHDANVMDLFIKGRDSYGSLSEAEKLRYNFLMTDTFWIGQQIWDRVKVGTLEAEIWTNNLFLYVGYISGEGSREWWEEYKQQYPADFVQAIEKGFVSGRDA